MLRTNGWAYAMDTDIKKWFIEEYDSEDKLQVGQELFTVINSGSDEEKFNEASYATDWTNFEDEGQIIYDNAVDGKQKTIVPKQWTGGMQLERKLVDDAKINMIKILVKAKAMGAARKKETERADVFNNAFSTTTVADGLSLCNSAHTSEQSGVATQSNSGTLALTETNIGAVKLLMRNFKAPSGKKMMVNPDMIIAPWDQERNLRIILKTINKVSSADNDINPSYGDFKPFTWGYLTDSNNWYMVDSRLMKLFLLFINRINTEAFSMVDFDTLVAKYAGYMRFAVGTPDWRWIYGNEVA